MFLSEKQGYKVMFSARCAGGKHGNAAGLLVESRIGKVDVLLIHTLFGKGNGLTEALEMDDLPLTQEADHIVDIRVVGQSEDIVIGKAGLLFCCDLVRTTFSNGAKGKD